MIQATTTWTVVSSTPALIRAAPGRLLGGRRWSGIQACSPAAGAETITPVPHHLAQQMPDAGDWTVTTFIALLAAITSLATLVVTTIAAGRRERAKWAREELSQAFYEFIDASFRTRDSAKDLQDLHWAGASVDRLSQAAAVVEDQRTALRHSQTKIRLLAPNATFQEANELRMTIKRLTESIGPDLDRAGWDVMAREVAAQREILVRSAKNAMSLPK
jgi:hypothetical protein